MNTIDDMESLIDHMKNLIDLFSETSDSNRRDFSIKVSEYMRTIENEKTKHSVIECLEFIHSMASISACRHHKTTLKDKYPNRHLETCKNCGQSRLRWANYQEDSRGEIIASAAYTSWTYPNKK